MSTLNIAWQFSKLATGDDYGLLPEVGAAWGDPNETPAFDPEDAVQLNRAVQVIEKIVPPGGTFSLTDYAYCAVPLYGFLTGRGYAMIKGRVEGDWCEEEHNLIDWQFTRPTA